MGAFLKELGETNSFLAKASRLGMLISAYIGLPAAGLLLSMQLSKLDTLDKNDQENQKQIVRIIEQNFAQDRRLETLESDVKDLEKNKVTLAE